MFRCTWALSSSALVSSRPASALAASRYCGNANGVGGAPAVWSGFVAIHALNAGLNSSRKRAPVEVDQLGLAAGIRVHPLHERRDVDLLLRVGQVRCASRLDPGLVDAARRLRLLAVPARCLIAAPRGRDGRDGEQNRGGDLDPVPPVAFRSRGRVPLSVTGQLHALVDGLQRLVDDVRSVRSIATGRTPPTPL